LKKISVKILVFSLSVLIGSSCIAQKKKGGNQKYSEDLSKVQPTYSYNLDSLLIKDTTKQKEDLILVSKYSVNKDLNPIFDSITELNKNIKYTRGYRVLVFSGNSQEEALEVRKFILELFELEENNAFTNTKVDFIYHQPMFRIKVGEYNNRLDAVRMTEFLKTQEFDFGEDSEIKVNPLVVPDNIDIRK